MTDLTRLVTRALDRGAWALLHAAFLLVIPLLLVITSSALGFEPVAELDLVTLAEVDLVGWAGAALGGAMAFAVLGKGLRATVVGRALPYRGAPRLLRASPAEIAFQVRHRLIAWVPHDRAGPAGRELLPARLAGEPPPRAPFTPANPWRAADALGASRPPADSGIPPTPSSSSLSIPSLGACARG